MLIGCYYYAWYGKNWLASTVRAKDPPSRGEYDNTGYCKVLDEQMAEMKAFGVDFVAVSYWAKDYGYVLDAAAKAGLKVTYFYETLTHKDAKGWVPDSGFPAIRANLTRIKQDMAEDCWLRVGGRPVLMFYVTRALTDPRGFANMVRSEIPGVFIVGDEYFWSNPTDARVTPYDALTAYNMYQPGRFSAGADHDRMETYLKASKSKMMEHSAQCARLSKPLWGCAMPGYDDAGFRPQDKHPHVPRMGTSFFERSLADAAAVSAGKEAVMVCSYNEWYEDTQIEGCGSYGKKYLHMLNEFKLRHLKTETK